MTKILIKLSTVILSTILSLSSIAAYADQQNKLDTNVQNIKEKAIKTISINKADAKLLVSLKGIGKKTAQAIVDYRNENGDFKSISELLKVKGVGSKALEKNKNLLTI